MQKTTTLKDFDVLNKLGEGAFGQVFKVKRKVDGQVYAMKKVQEFLQKDKTCLNETKITLKCIK